MLQGQLSCLFCHWNLSPWSRGRKIALQYDLNHGNMNVSFAANGFFKKAKAFMENIPFKEKKKWLGSWSVINRLGFVRCAHIFLRTEICLMGSTQVTAVTWPAWLHVQVGAFHVSTWCLGANVKGECRSGFAVLNLRCCHRRASAEC